MKTRLYGNFFVHEVSKSLNAIREGIDNTPDEEQLIQARNVAEYILQPLRDHYGIAYSPQSWFRCESLEKYICYKSYVQWCRQRNFECDNYSWNIYFQRKQHPTGGACDIEIPGVANLDLYTYIKNNLEFDQLILEFYNKYDPTSGWVHVSYVHGRNRNQAFEIK